MTAGQPAGLVLAAGAGRRFGGPKAFAVVDGERLVDRAVRVLRQGGCRPVVVVLGAAVGQVPDADVVVVNAAWREGIGSSLRRGLGAAELQPADAVQVLLVDQPGVTPDAVRAVTGAWRRGARLAVAEYADGRGHPVLLGREHWGAVARSARGDTGARGYLQDHADAVLGVDCRGLGSAVDVDTAGQPAGPAGPAG